MKQLLDSATVIVAVVVSTILVMIVTGHIQQFMEGRRK